MNSVTDIIAWIDHAAFFGNWSFIDERLKNLDIRNTEVVDMVAYARASFPFRSKLNNWQLFIKRVEAELKAGGHDTQRILMGLL